MPLSLLLVGAGATVGVTAVVVTLDTPPAGGPRGLGTVPWAVVGPARVGARVVFLAGVVAAAAAGVGVGVPAEVAPVFVWPLWLHGLGLLAVLVGSPWPLLSPWRACYRALCRIEGREVALAGDPPAWLGRWPALVAFVALVGVVENLTVLPRSAGFTAGIVGAYGLWAVGGAALFGAEWLDRADPLAVFYDLLGRVAPVTTRRDGGLRIAVRAPWTDTRPVADLATAVFVVAAVYTVTFDGFGETRLYRSLLAGARDALGTGPPTSLALYAAGLAGFVGLFLAAARLGDALGGTGTAPTDAGRPSAARAFAPAVLPVAAAYDVAHNYPYVVRNAVRLAEVVGLAASADPLAALSLPAYWGSQVALVVLGHLFAVVATARVSRARHPVAWRGHLPFVAVTVGYTVLSLWVVSRPVVA